MHITFFYINKVLIILTFIDCLLKFLFYFVEVAFPQHLDPVLLTLHTRISRDETLRVPISKCHLEVQGLFLFPMKQ